MGRLHALAIVLLVAFLVCFSFNTVFSYSPEIYQAQKALKELGYDPGPVDGIWGKATERAIKYFQVDKVLPVTGQLDGQTKEKLGIGSSDRGIRVKLRTKESPDAPVAEEVNLYGSSYALIIGIDNYTQGWPRLSNAVRDAKLVAAELRKKGFDVTLKTNLASGELKKIFEEFFIIKGDNTQARLFVWFAGHGHTLDGEGFLVPTDAPRPDKGAQFRLKALSMRRFGEYVRLAQSKHAFAVFDSCFSGTVFTTQRSSPPIAVTRATTLPVRQFLSSGDAQQQVSDDGMFRKLFVRAIRGEERADANGDGYLTGSELGLFLTDRMTNLTRSAQTPRYGKLRDPDYDRGDFVFLLASSGAIIEKPTSKPSRTHAIPAPPAVPQKKAPRISRPPELKGKGDIYIESSPSGAVVYLNRKKRGRTPLELSNVPSGRHIIELKKGKIYSAKLQIDLEADDFVKRKVKLKRAKGKVKISSEPSGAKIFLDYLDTGMTTPDILHTEAGEYNLVLEKKAEKGLLLYAKKIMVEPDRKVALSIKMQRSPGETRKLLMAAIEKAKKNKRQVFLDAKLAGWVFGPLNITPKGYTQEELKSKIEQALSSMDSHYDNQFKSALRKYSQRAKSKDGIAAAKKELKKRIRKIGSPAEHERRMLDLKARQIVANYAVWENELDKSLIEAKKYLEDMAINDPALEKNDVNDYLNSHWKKDGSFYESNIDTLRKVVNISKFEDVKNIVLNKVRTNFSDWLKQ